MHSTHICTHTHAHEHKQTHTPTHRHADTHKHTKTPKYRHTHAHPYTPIKSDLLSSRCPVLTTGPRLRVYTLGVIPTREVIGGDSVLLVCTNRRVTCHGTTFNTPALSHAAIVSPCTCMSSAFFACMACNCTHRTHYRCVFGVIMHTPPHRCPPSTIGTPARWFHPIRPPLFEAPKPPPYPDLQRPDPIGPATRPNTTYAPCGLTGTHAQHTHQHTHTHTNTNKHFLLAVIFTLRVILSI